MGIVELKDWEEKVKIIKNKQKLKELKDTKVLIANGLTSKEHSVQKHIREFA